MRQLVVGCLMLGGCLVENPAWQRPGQASTSETSSSGATTGTSDDPTMSMIPTMPTTSGEGEATADAGSGSTDSTTSLTDPVGTTGDASTGDEGTTGAVGPVCMASELVALKMPDGAPQDAGVVASTLGTPCPWNAGQPECGPLNFGKTGFFRLVNDPVLGVDAALIRFPAEDVAKEILGSGHDPEDLIGARLELVIWEPKSGPDAAIDLQVHLLHVDNFDWSEGDRDAEPAQDHDSSALCRTRDKGECVAWAQGDALAGAQPLGLLHVTPENAKASDGDGSESEYHAKLISESLGMPLLFAYQNGDDPALAVTLASPRGVGEGTIGIKMRESEWSDPTLYAEFCTEWAP